MTQAGTRSGPELLAPAGTLKNLGYALAYGAAAVYAGIPRYSLRVRDNDFDGINLARGIRAAHALGRRFYLAANLLPRAAKLDSFLADMRPILEPSGGESPPDAIIMADPGLIALAREHWPALPIHLSVQANTTNAAAVRFWRRQGISRVILSRELSLEEIARIRADCPDIELEVFVHGAMCIAYSGRCLLSGYLNHRDANQGSCTNACRWRYRLGHSPDPDDATAPLSDGAQWLIEEAERPGEFMPVFEDEHGTYILNAKDLRAVEHVERLVEIGVDCLKIEGRTKSHYYVARTTQVYRAALDDALAGRPFRRELLTQLDGLANRGYTEGFYRRHAEASMQNYAEGASRNDRQIFVGDIAAIDTVAGFAEVEVKNRFAVGDRLEWISPAGNRTFRLTELSDRDGQPLHAAPGAGWRVRLRLPAPLAPLDPADQFHGFGLLARYL